MANNFIRWSAKKVVLLALAAMSVYSSASAEIISQAQIQTPKVQAEQLQVTATKWGLTKDDYQIYLKEMQSPIAKLWWQHLAPPQVLGMNATTEAKRMKYARIDAKLDYERASKEVAFQRAYTQAFNALYPNAKVIQTTHSNLSSNSVLQPGDSLYVFTPLNNPEGGLMVSKLLGYLRHAHRVAINIFFMGKPSYSEIQRWANANNVPKGFENNNVVTLNLNDKNGKSMLASIVGTKKVSLPIVIRVRNRISSVVSLGGVG